MSEKRPLQRAMNRAEFGDLYKATGEKGVEQRPKTPPTLEDHIRGYTGSSDPSYGLQMLISQYEHQRRQQPFHVGDVVRVRKQFWGRWETRPTGRSGWSGYAQMFADAEATVVKVEWNISENAWGVLAEYENPYLFSDFDGGRFYVDDRSVSFYMWPEFLEKVPAPEPEKCECCGQAIHG